MLLTAIKCLEISLTVAVFKNQFFADLALVSVSIVVKVFDTTYYSVDHGIDSDGSKEERLNVVPYQEEMKKKGLRIKHMKN